MKKKATRKLKENLEKKESKCFCSAWHKLSFCICRSTAVICNHSFHTFLHSAFCNLELQQKFFYISTGDIP